MEKYLMYDSPKNTHRENTSTKNTPTKNTSSRDIAKYTSVRF